MKINSIQNQNAFKGVTVTTSSKNSGKQIRDNVIIPFRETAQKISDKKGSRYADIIDTTEVFVAAAGKGKRCLPLTHMQGDDVTKVYYGIPEVDKQGKATGKMLYVLNIPMASAAPLLDEDGLKTVNAPVAKGSFAEVISFAKDRREQGLEQKDIIFMCGDNFFGVQGEDEEFEILDYLRDVIKDDSKVLGLVGVKRTPEETVNNFGCLKALPTGKDDIYKLDKFLEKPKTVELAKDFATDDGNCVANTGTFVMKKEAMDWLLDKIEEDPMFIARDDSEPYDFALASTKVQEHFGTDMCTIKIVKDWEDAGQPDTMAKLTEEFSKGRFLTYLPRGMQEAFKRSAAATCYNDGAQTTILATPKAVDTFKSARKLADYIDATDTLPKTSQVEVKDIEGMHVAGVVND